MSDVEKVPRKRKRVGAACERCSRLKQSCDSARPCQRCLKAGAHCATRVLPPRTAKGRVRVACLRCHGLKLSCDMARPCARCTRAGALCEDKAAARAPLSKKLKSEPPALEPAPDVSERGSSLLKDMLVSAAVSAHDLTSLRHRAHNRFPQGVSDTILGFYQRFSPFVLKELILDRHVLFFSLLNFVADSCSPSSLEVYCDRLFDTAQAVVSTSEEAVKLQQYREVSFLTCSRRPTYLYRALPNEFVQISEFFKRHCASLGISTENMPIFQMSFLRSNIGNVIGFQYAMNSEAEALFEFSSEEFVEVANSLPDVLKPFEFNLFSEDSLDEVIHLKQSNWYSLEWKSAESIPVEFFSAQVVSKSGRRVGCSVLSAGEVNLDQGIPFRRTIGFIPKS